MAEQPRKALTPAQEQRRKAIVRRARAAATAAGKEWLTLSKDERKAYREQARIEVRNARKTAKAQQKSP